MEYMILPCSHCLMLLTHSMRRAFSFARDKAGNNRAARIAMMAMTINSSISVNPPATFELFFMSVRMMQKRWVTPPNARDEVRRPATPGSAQDGHPALAGACGSSDGMKAD